LLQWQDCGKI